MQRIIFVLLLLLPIGLFAQDSELYKFLKAIPGAEVQKKDATSFAEFYVVMLPQPVDHNNPSGAKFKQRIFVGHRGFDRPVVLETEGYGAQGVSPKTTVELTKLLDANQLFVEHRYFGLSTPDPLDWKFLNAEQDAGDYHQIRQIFGQIYKGKWIATGVSKGGQTTTEYKVYYPDDVDVSVPYVAPLNYARLDKRIDKHFKKVGTSKDRKQLKDIQNYLLKNKFNVMPIWQNRAEKAGFKFTFLDAETAYDYSVLELPFSFWQYTADPAKLEDMKTANAEDMANFLFRIVSPYWYTEAAKSLEPAMYQFYTQLGYYEYDEKPFRKYLKHHDYLNSDFVPAYTPIAWDNSYQDKLKKFIKSKPQHMIFIYGESDPWGATAAKIKTGSGSMKFVKKNGTHGTTISTLNETQRKELISTLEDWLGMKIDL